MATETEPVLAIIIPAYRLCHLRQALESLAAQTNGRFRVYIGDDASPEPLGSIIDQFASRLDLRYQRFSENLGRHDLIGHWERCVSLTQTESWLWLFSDDDQLEPECVAGFYRTLEERVTPAVELYRFQMDFIDESSARSHRPAAYPTYETATELLAGLLTDRRRAWRAQNHIFSRSVHQRTGGFVSFPYAIYSDFATWLRFASRQGVRTIPDARVLWRHHSAGISSGQRDLNRREWQSAAAAYLTWLAQFSHEEGAQAEEIFQAHGRTFYFTELSQFRPRLASQEYEVAVALASKLFKCSRLSASSQLRYTLFRAQVGPTWRSLRKHVRALGYNAKHVFGHAAES